MRRPIRPSGIRRPIRRSGMRRPIRPSGMRRPIRPSGMIDRWARDCRERERRSRPNRRRLARRVQAHALAVERDVVVRRQRHIAAAGVHPLRVRLGLDHASGARAQIAGDLLLQRSGAQRGAARRPDLQAVAVEAQHPVRRHRQRLRVHLDHRAVGAQLDAQTDAPVGSGQHDQILLQRRGAAGDQAIAGRQRRQGHRGSALRRQGDYFSARSALHWGESYTHGFTRAIGAAVTSSSHHGDIATSPGSGGRAGARVPRRQTISAAPIASGAMKRFPGGVSTAP